MHDSLGVDKNQTVSAHERMCSAIDAQPREYFTTFGITKEGWQKWRHTSQGAPSTGTKEWTFPRLTQLVYPRAIKSTQDWDNWVKGVNLDRRLSDRCRRVLTSLAMYLNLKTGRCDPTVHHLAMMAGLGDDESAQRMARSALSEGENAGWIRRKLRNGGLRTNRSSYYEFLIPAAILTGSKDIDPVRTDSPPRPDKSGTPSGQMSPPEQGKEEQGKKEHLSISREPSSLCSDGPLNLSEERKGEFERELAALSRQPIFTEEDVGHVRDLILQEVGEFPRTLSIAKIVGMSREAGGYEYPINGRQIAAMADAGHLGRIDNSVFVPQGAAPDVGARTEGVKM